MATVVNKDFKIKSGLIVEGTTGRINNFDILTKKQADQDYIIDLIGGETLVKSVSAEFDVSVSGELSLDRATVDAYYDAAGSADTAEDNANSYTNTALLDYTTTANLDTTVGGYGYLKEADLGDYATEAYADSAAAGALEDAQNYADALINDASNSTTEVWSAYKTNTEIGLAEGRANDYTDDELLNYTPTANLDTTVGGYGYLKSADLTGYATETYVNDAVDALVDGAPGLLDTLNEIAAAINDDENYATTITTALAGKQGTLTAGDNISIVSDTISVTGLDSTDISDFATAAQSAGTGYFDLAGAAQDVADDLLAHEGLSSGVHGVTGTIVGTSDSQTLTNKTIDGMSNTISNIDNTSLVNYSIDINGYTTNLGSSVTLNTDDIDEGITNQYFTDDRAKAATKSLLTGTNTTLTNISISENGAGGLDITAENGVADSDTDDLTEGTTNLYFTDQRAVDALEAVVPNFEAIEIDSVAKQVAATLEAATAGVQTAYSWNTTSYRSAEFLVKVANGTHTEISKVLLTLDTGDNIAITEYGIVGTNGSLATVSAAMNGSSTADLKVTTANNNSIVTVVGTLLA